MVQGHLVQQPADVLPLHLPTRVSASRTSRPEAAVEKYGRIRYFWNHTGLSALDWRRRTGRDEDIRGRFCENFTQILTQEERVKTLILFERRPADSKSIYNQHKKTRDYKTLILLLFKNSVLVSFGSFWKNLTLTGTIWAQFSGVDLLPIPLGLRAISRSIFKAEFGGRHL